MFHYHWVTTGNIYAVILFWKYFIWEKMQNVNQIYKAMDMEFMEDI